jgi:hypothetical protein
LRLGGDVRSRVGFAVSFGVQEPVSASNRERDSSDVLPRSLAFNRRIGSRTSARC